MNELGQSTAIIIISIHAMFPHVAFVFTIRVKNDKNKGMNEFSFYFSKSLQPGNTWNYSSHKQMPSEKIHAGHDCLC